jgi:hypothetical protein
LSISGAAETITVNLGPLHTQSQNSTASRRPLYTALYSAARRNDDPRMAEILFPPHALQLARITSRLHGEATHNATKIKGAAMTTVDQFFESIGFPRAKESTVAEAFAAQDLLRLLVKWHGKNTEQMLPTELMLLLVAARRVC